MPIKRISPERRKKTGPMDARDWRMQYALRRTPAGIEYSKDLQNWHPEGRRVKREIGKALGTRKVITGTNSNLFADRGIAGRKKRR